MGHKSKKKWSQKTFDWRDYDENDDKKKWTNATTYCHESHPILKLGNGEIVGASCSHPRPGFDVYVALSDSAPKVPVESYPWNKENVDFVLFHITDYSVPKDIENFKKMVKWIKHKLDIGKRVHIGCWGGHGRTGLVLSALVSLYGEKDAITWVRKNHCDKAVESASQVDLLVEHYGVTRVKNAKGSGSSTGTYGGYTTGAGHTYYGSGYTVGSDGVVNFTGSYSNISKPQTYAPAVSPKRSIWRKN